MNSNFWIKFPIQFTDNTVHGKFSQFCWAKVKWEYRKTILGPIDLTLFRGYSFRDWKNYRKAKLRILISSFSQFHRGKPYANLLWHLGVQLGRYTVPGHFSFPLYVNRLRNSIPLQRNGVLEKKSNAFGFVWGGSRRRVLCGERFFHA